ncbi:MAG TPA: YfhO family protein [Thermoanaerobaculia bacterium]|nr:YfhO family protein [Thermoanaerobaculia bacterium]
MEPAVAALIPALAALAATLWPRMPDDLRRAIRFWFVPLALLWLAPSWLTGRTPVAFDLLGQIWPWRTLAVAPPAGNPLLNDAVFQFLPWRQGNWRFLWTNPQAALLYPLTWLGAPFSAAAWPLFAGEAKLLIASIGTYVFLRREERSHHAALLGAVAYAFGVFTIAFLFAPQTNVTVMLPWMLIAVQRGHALGALAFFLAAAGGHPESLVHAMLVVVPYAMRQGGRAAGRAAVIAIAGFALAAPQLVPFASVAGESERMAQIARDPSLLRAPALTFANLAGYVAPSLLKDRIAATWRENFNEVATQYAGVITLLLALFAARRQRFWFAIFLVASVLAFDILPQIGPMLHGRLRFVVAFAMAVLAAHALDRTPRLLPLAVAADLFFVMFNFYPPVDPRWAYPTTPAIAKLHGRIATVGLTLAPNTATMYGLDDIGRHDPTAWEPYMRALESAGYDRRGYFAVFHQLPPRAFLDFIGVRYAILPPDVAGTPPLPVVYRGPDAIVLANPTARPGPGSAVVTDSAVETFMATNETAIPGWSLTRDGDAHEIVRVHGAFIGWRVPPGRHRFVLTYTPPHLLLGVVIALMGMALIVVTLRRP